MNDINFQAESEFQPTIKDAVKFAELPEIRDTVHRITNANYGIVSIQLSLLMLLKCRMNR